MIKIRRLKKNEPNRAGDMFPEVPTDKQMRLQKREIQRKLRERHGTPSLSLTEEFLSLPYWARYDLDDINSNSTFYSWILDKSLFERKPHKIHKTIEADFYTHSSFVLESMIENPIHWEVRESVGRTSATLSIPCNHDFVIKVIFDMVAAMGMEITSFGVDDNNKVVHIVLDDTHTLKESFDNEYQAIMKLYRFVWELHNEVFSPSLMDFKGQFDINYDEDAGENYIELFDIIALGSFMQEYKKFARRGILIPLSQIRSLQNGYMFDKSDLGITKIGKVALLEGDFTICYALNELS